MSIKRLKILVPLLALVFFCFKADAQNSASSTLDNTSIPIGAQTVLRISVHVPAKSGISFPQLKDSIGKIKFVGTPKTDSVPDSKDAAIEIITQRYTVTAFEAGAYVIPSFEFHTSAGFFRTTALTLTVKPVPVDTTKTFYDIKQPFVVGYTFWDWLRDHWVIVVLIFAALLLVSAVALYLKSRLKGPLIKKTTPFLTIDQLAVKKLYELRDKKLCQQHLVKEHYIELTDILRDYLAARYQISTHEQTSAEIFAALEDKQLSARANDILKKVLTLADLVKFAKQNPSPTENEQCLEDAVNFIKQTAQAVQITNQKEGHPDEVV